MVATYGLFNTLQCCRFPSYPSCHTVRLYYSSKGVTGCDSVKHHRVAPQDQEQRPTEISLQSTETLSCQSMQPWSITRKHKYLTQSFNCISDEGMQSFELGRLKFSLVCFYHLILIFVLPLRAMNKLLTEIEMFTVIVRNSFFLVLSFDYRF